MDLLQETSSLAAVQNLLRTNPYWSQYLVTNPYFAQRILPGLGSSGIGGTNNANAFMNSNLLSSFSGIAQSNSSTAAATVLHNQLLAATAAASSGMPLNLGNMDINSSLLQQLRNERPSSTNSSGVASLSSVTNTLSSVSTSQLKTIDSTFLTQSNICDAVSPKTQSPKQCINPKSTDLINNENQLEDLPLTDQYFNKKDLNDDDINQRIKV